MIYFPQNMIRWTLILERIDSFHRRFSPEIDLTSLPRVLASHLTPCRGLSLYLNLNFISFEKIPFHLQWRQD